MKLLRYGEIGNERPAILDQDGGIRDLGNVLADLSPDQLAPAALQKLQAIDVKSLPMVSGAPRIGVPVAGIRQLIAIGTNYREHAIEANLPIPDEPIIFIKAISGVCGPDDDIVMPPHATKLDWEVELGIVIGTQMSCVPESAALEYVAGYCVANDVSERGFQFERGGTWDKGKGFPTSGPLGPYLVTPDEVSDPQNLSMWLDVNDVRKQTGNTRTMIFGCAQLLSYVSHFITLLPGDVVVTGTPPGVGVGFKPPQFLQAGDTVTLGIEGLGQQQQRVVKSAQKASLGSLL